MSKSGGREGDEASEPIPADALTCEVGAVLASPALARSPVVRQVLELLAAARPPGDELTQYSLAEALYGDAGDVERARAAVRALRGKLIEHYTTTGAGSPRRLEVPAGEYRLRLVEVAPPIEPPRSGGQAGSRNPRRGWRQVASRRFVALLVAAAITSYAVGMAHRSQGPATYRWLSTSLVIVDARGRDLWPLDFRRPVTTPDDSTPPRVVLDDLDGDTLAEVVVVPAFGLGECNDRVWCLRSDGTVLWEAQLGADVSWGRRPLPNCFNLIRLEVFRDVPGAAPVIVATVGHDFASASSLVVLDPATGDERGRYWNAGHLREMSAWDADADDPLELVLAGCHNPSTAGALVILEPRELRAGAEATTCPPWDGGHAPDGLEPDAHQRFVLIPGPLPPEWAARAVVASVEPGPRALTAVVAQEEDVLRYTFDTHLGCLVESTREFELWYAAQRERGRLTGALDSAYLDGLCERVRVWQAGSWRTGRR
jgi:hypothetical protein